MNIKLKYSILLVVVLLFTSCKQSKTEELPDPNDISSIEELAATPSVETVNPATDKPINSPADLQKLFFEYDAKIMESIKRYNSERSEYLTKEEDIFGRSSEGGHIAREYKDNKFVAYESDFLGGIGKVQYNYYSFDGFSYLIKTIEEYNAPFYYTKEKVAEEELDMEPFDPQRSKVTTEEYIKDNTYVYKIDREKQELIIEQDTEKINTFTICQEDALEKPTEPASAENLQAQASFSKYNIFAVNSLLLGGYYDNKWINDDELFPMIGETEFYKIYINNSYQGVEAGTKASSERAPLFCGNSIDFVCTQYDGINDVFAFSSHIDLNIEYGKKLSSDSDIYKNALIEYMTEAGYKGEFTLGDILKFDVDKDGEDEVFISASNLSDENLPEYADRVLYMRKIVDGKVKNISFPIDEPVVSADNKKIIGFCDLNDDGINEIVVKVRGIGYVGYSVYELKESRFIRIFENGNET